VAEKRETDGPSADVGGRNHATRVVRGAGIAAGEAGIKACGLARVGADQHVKAAPASLPLPWQVTAKL
jgi:hypothetical protein